jgi:hypothetical protein
VTPVFSSSSGAPKISDAMLDDVVIIGLRLKHRAFPQSDVRWLNIPFWAVAVSFRFEET